MENKLRILLVSLTQLNNNNNTTSMVGRAREGGRGGEGRGGFIAIGDYLESIRLLQCIHNINTYVPLR